MGNNLGGLYDTTQKDLFAGKNLRDSEDFLYDPLVMDVTPTRTDAPKYYELVDSVLGTFSKVCFIFFFVFYFILVFVTFF